MSDPSSTDCDFFDFIDRGRKLLIQDVAQLMNIVQTHILFDHEVFKTDLFLKYKETMATF